jgi:hypothetical protein
MRASTSSGSTGSNQVPPEPNSRFSRATPVPPMAQAMVVGMDQTIICCLTSEIPIMRLTTQNRLSLK